MGEDRTREIESNIEIIRNKISESRQNIQNREIQIEENEKNLIQTENERFIKIIEKENYLLGQENEKLEELKIKLKESELNLELSRIEWSQVKEFEDEIEFNE